MDGNEDKELDAQIDQLLTGGNGESETTAPADTQEEGGGPTPSATRETSETQAEYEVGGRKYTLDGLKRTVESQLSHIKKLEGEGSKLKKWAEGWQKLEAAWKQDPALYKHMRTAHEEYQKLRSQGATKTEAKEATGLQNVPKDVLDKLDRAVRLADQTDQRESEASLDREVSEFRKTVKIDDATVDRTFKYMLRLAEERQLDVPFEVAYYAMTKEDAARRSKMSEAELKRVKNEANVGTSQHQSVQEPNRPVGDLTDQEADKIIGQFAARYGGA